MLLNTARCPWKSLRSAVATDDSPALSSFNFSDWPSANTVKLSEPPLADANGIFIAFHGTDANGEAFAYKLYGRARMNGPILLLLTGVVTLGAQNCTTDPIDGSTAIGNGEWADTITATGGILSSLVDILDAGNDMICVLKFDQLNIEELYCEINLDTAASAYAIISGY